MRDEKAHLNGIALQATVGIKSLKEMPGSSRTLSEPVELHKKGSHLESESSNVAQHRTLAREGQCFGRIEYLFGYMLGERLRWNPGFEHI